MSPNSKIRVAVLDDHASVRAGLEAIVSAEPDLIWVGAAADAAALDHLLRRTRPDVLVLDVDHPGEDGLQLSLRLQRELSAPRIVLHSSRASAEMTVAAAAVGADAVVSKADTPRALLEAIREVAHGRAALPEIPLTLRARFAARLEPTDRAILAMRLAGTAPAEIAETIGVTAARVRARIARIVARLTPAAPLDLAPAGAAPDFGPPRR